MDALGPMHPLYAPRGLSTRRLMRWCIQRTRLDIKRSQRRGREISRFNAVRLLKRRASRLGLAAGGSDIDAALRLY